MSLRRIANALLMSLSIAGAAPSAMAGNVQVLDFESPTTALPWTPGVTYLFTDPFYLQDGDHWFAGGVSFLHMFRTRDAPFGQGAFGNISGSPGYSDLGLRLDTPVQSVGAWLFGCPVYVCGATPAAIEMIGRNAVGDIVAQKIVVMPAQVQFTTTPSWVEIEAAEGISQVEWRVTGPTRLAGHFEVDNVVLTAMPVPEPSTGLLVCAGALFLAVRSRRRTR